MQLEVVLLLEGLLAGGTLEAAADAVRGQVAPEVSLALENLEDREEGGGRGGHFSLPSLWLVAPVGVSLRSPERTFWQCGQGKQWEAVRRCCSRASWVEYRL